MEGNGCPQEEKEAKLCCLVIWKEKQH
jgi:hypothetical protein